MAWFEMNTESVDKLMESIDRYGDNARNTINDVFHGEGAKEIKNDIAKILPVSGRTWRGKPAPASAVMPGQFRQDNGNMSVTIAARGTYHYLYFPDDGSNTVHHAGNQQFMMHGAEDATEAIVDNVTNKLVEAFGE